MAHGALSLMGDRMMRGWTKKARVVTTGCLWMGSSVLMNVVIKLVNGRHYGAFVCPLLLTTVQFALQSMLVELAFCTSIPLKVFGVHEAPAEAGPLSGSVSHFFIFFWPALATSLDIGLSNLAMRFITLVLATSVKASSPLFTMLLAFALRLEDPSLRLVASVLLLSSGLSLAVLGESPNSFNSLGFSLMLSASFLAGVRWTLMQRLLHGKSSIRGIESPIVLLKFLLPLMSACLAPLSAAVEHWRDLRFSPYLSHDHWHLMLGITVGVSILALVMTTFEFLLVSELDALTFLVLGLLKEAITVAAGAFFFSGSKLGVLNALGFILILAGVSSYKWTKTVSGENSNVPLDVDHGSYTQVDSEPNGDHTHDNAIHSDTAKA